jgi:hypothetical protein
MALINRIKSHLSGSQVRQKVDTDRSRGLVIFRVVEEAIKAEKLLKKAGIRSKLVAPPPAMRQGCDLSLEIDLVEQPSIQRTLEASVPFVGIFPLKGSAELLNIVKISNYGDYVMVKAVNMKLVFDSRNGLIVNTSGGGCPDIPYLNIQLVGKKLTEAIRPKETGFTLCALMLDRAFEEACVLWEGRYK